MRITLLSLFAGMLMAAQAPVAPEPKTPVAVPFTEVLQARLDLARTTLENAKLRSDIEVQSILTQACKAAGGADAAACTFEPPNQAQPRYTASLKPVAPVVAKAEVKP